MQRRALRRRSLPDQCCWVSRYCYGGVRHRLDAYRHYEYASRRCLRVEQLSEVARTELGQIWTNDDQPRQQLRRQPSAGRAIRRLLDGPASATQRIAQSDAHPRI